VPTATCPVVSLIGTTIVERATQGTSSDVDVPAGVEVGDLLYLSVNKDDEDAGYVAAVIGGGDPDWVVLAGGNTDHFIKVADAGDVAPGASVNVVYGPGDRYAVLTLAVWRCLSPDDTIVAYDTLTHGADLTEHDVPALVAPEDDYLLIAGAELGKDTPGAFTWPAPWTVFGGGESPGGLGTTPTTSSTLAFRRFHGANPPAVTVESENAMHSGTWQVALKASLDPFGWDVFAAAAPNGDRLDVLDGAASGRSVRVALNDTGSGKFTVNRFLPQAAAAVMAKGNIVKCRFPWRDDYDVAFILEKGDFKLATKDEKGGENLDYGGRGILAYLSRARMWWEAFTVGVDISDTWAKVWQATKVPNPVGSAVVDDDPTYLYVISATSRKIYKIRQSDRVIVSSSPALWSGSTKYAGGLGADPADATILWVLEAPWAFGGSGNTKIRKVRISDWAILATYDLGSAVQLSAIKADATRLWVTKYDGPDVQERDKADGSVLDSHSIVYGGTAQVHATGISVNGTKLAYWFQDKKRALIADSSDPETITDKISTTGLSAFGGDWTTEGAEDFFYPVSFTADTVWKYQLTAATPRDPVKGIWRLDEGSAGAILWRIIQEAQAPARPQQPIPDLTYVFTSALDSAGNAWDAHDGAAEFDAKVGDDVLPTTLRLVPYGLVERMSPYLKLDAFNAATYGVDRTGDFGAGVVRFEKGVNIVPDLTRKERERELHSDMLAGGKGGLYATAELDTLGYVREGFIGTDIEDAGALAGTAAAELDNERVVNERITFRVVRGPDDGSGEGEGLYLPFTHVNVGDLATLHTGTGEIDHNEQAVRIYAMTLEEGPAGDWGTYVIEAGSAYLDENAPASTQSGGSAGGSGTGGGTTVVNTDSDVTLRDGESGEEASGSILESDDIAVFGAGPGVAGFILKPKPLEAASNWEGEAADGQVPTYDAALEAWIPSDPAGSDSDDFLTRRGGEGHELSTISISGDAVEIDWSDANRFDITLTDDPDITFAGLPAFGLGAEIGVTIRQDLVGGHAIASWPASVAWRDPATGLPGAAPVIPTDPGASLFVLLSTSDGGINVGGSFETAPVLELGDLSDVTLTSPAELDTLRRVGSAWVNDGRIWRPLMDGLGNVIVDSGTGDAIMALA
jgi:hypothetical protein